MCHFKKFLRIYKYRLFLSQYKTFYKKLKITVDMQVRNSLHWCQLRKGGSRMEFKLYNWLLLALSLVGLTLSAYLHFWVPAVIMAVSTVFAVLAIRDSE